MQLDLGENINLGLGLNIEVLRVGERMIHAAMSGNMLGQKITLYTMTIAD